MNRRKFFAAASGLLACLGLPRPAAAKYRWDLVYGPLPAGRAVEHKVFWIRGGIVKGKYTTNSTRYRNATIGSIDS